MDFYFYKLKTTGNAKVVKLSDGTRMPGFIPVVFSLEE